MSFNRACGLLEQLRLLHLFSMDAMRVIDQTLGNTVPLLKKCNLQVSDSSRWPWSRSNASSSMSQTCSVSSESGACAGHSIRCIVSASSMFSTNRKLYAVGHYHPGRNKGISNGSSVRDDMVKVSRLHTFGPSKCRSNDIQVRTSRLC
ncbi:hypothetical protein TNCV_340591 [Trichonephila clavipes]|uniref:Uncharacterized protein n=1 Tax=Trichonephila clavipes TaxID=2585209 RepID=A0A8X6VQD6_TRICX|nr:hypothetical protein TNCV_340591 [Trichonephila clavipes]